MGKHGLDGWGQVAGRLPGTLRPIWGIILKGMYEKKEPTDDTSKDVYSLLAQHVSGIIMPIIRRQTE